MSDANGLFSGTYGTMYYVHDMEKSIQYYKDAFGATPVFESPDWTEFSLGGHSLCLHAVKPGEKSDGKGILITKVKDLHGIVRTLKSRGVEFANDVHSVCEGGYAADFRDPSGNLVSLFEYTGN